MLRKSAVSKAASQAAQEIKRMKVPSYQADLTTIQNQFMAAVKEVKKRLKAISQPPNS